MNRRKDNKRMDRKLPIGHNECVGEDGQHGDEHIVIVQRLDDAMRRVTCADKKADDLGHNSCFII